MEANVTITNGSISVKQHNSSNINTSIYSEDQQKLEIAFKAGDTYVYSGVPKEVYEAFCRAESPGKYLRAHIAMTYKFKKV